MTYDNIVLSIEEEIAIITINRPELRNALDMKTWIELRQAFDWLDNNDSIKVIILTGSGEKAFASGADLNTLNARSMVETLSGELSKILRGIENITKPTIAAVNGYALGGGCELAMACDLRVASENAKFGQPEINVGILPGAGGTQRLRRLIGLGKALELILTGEIISADNAEKFGLVNKVVPQEVLLAEAIKLAKKVSTKSPIVLRLAKLLVKHGDGTDFDTSLLLETLSQTVVFGTDDHTEGINAFLEKREPRFRGY